MRPVEPVLSVDDLRLSFQGIQAIAGVSLTLASREILGIIGPNGAGKTSVLNCINGFYRPQRGRVVAMDPQVLILDEPMAGMSADEKADMARYILELKDVRSLPMILIEHDMGVVMDLCDRLIVMDYGKKIAEGPPGAIQRHPEVIRAYIGEAAGGPAAH